MQVEAANAAALVAAGDVSWPHIAKTLFCIVLDIFCLFLLFVEFMNLL